MKTRTPSDAIAEADAELNDVGLPNYTHLMMALNAMVNSTINAPMGIYACPARDEALKIIGAVEQHMAVNI